MFDIPLGIEYSAMSTECIPARNLLELVPPAIHDWQLVFTMWPKVDLDWFALFCMSSAHQSFSMWPKVGRARRTPHLVSICLRTFHPWRGKISFTNSGGRHFTVTLMRDLSRFWSPPTVQSNILASWSKNQKPFRMSEGDESDGNLGVLLIRTLDDTRYSSKIAISWCSCLATSRWWWIQNRSSISYLTKFPRCWRFFRKILAYIQNFPCPFTSLSRLFALTTDLPGPADGPLNIVQGNILASWSQNPFRMSEGGESDGNLGVLHIRTLDETRYSSKIAISWCSCLATSRWWWIHHSSSIHRD